MPDHESEPVALADTLLEFARGASRLGAQVLDGGQPRAGAHAASWMRAAREALEARRLADEPLTDGERAAAAAHVTALRAKVETAGQALASVIDQRDDLATFLGQLAAKFETAQTPTAARLAAQIRRELADVFGAEDLPDSRPRGENEPALVNADDSPFRVPEGKTEPTA